MKVGVIGCGMIAKKAHLPAYQHLGMDIAAVADSEEKRAKSLAREFHADKWFKNYRDLLAEDLDVVSVCTPPSTHASMAIDAAKAGKHILLEKPMATNLREADEVLRVCRESNVRLCIMHNYRFFPCIVETKKRLDEGRIGKVVSAHLIGRDFAPMSWSPNSGWHYYEWGLVDDFGYHLVDIASYLCSSPVVDVKVVARDWTKHMGCLSHVQALMEFQSGAVVDLDISWITGAHELSLTILGTAGTLGIDIRNNAIREVHGYSTPLEEVRHVVTKLARVAGGVLRGSYFKGPILYHEEVIRLFAKSIVEGSPPPVLGEEGKEVITILHLIKERGGH